MRLSSVLLISALCTLALSQSFKFVNQTYYPDGNTTNLLKTSSGYVFGQDYFNFAAGQAHKISPSISCNFPGSVLAVNTLNQFFCFNKNGSQLSLVSVDPVTTNILTSIPYTGKNTEFILANGRYIILLAGILKRSISAEIYDPVTNSFFCPVSNVSYPASEELTDVAVYGESLIFLTINGHTVNTTMFYNVPCSSGQAIPTKLDEARYELNPYNTSGNYVLLSQTIFINDDQEFIIMAPVIFDLLGVPRFGGEVVLNDVGYQVNDTSLLLLEQNSAGTLDFLFAVITPQLTLQIVANISTQVNVEPFNVLGVFANSTSALMSDTGFFLFVFDYVKQEVTQIWNIEYQYLLANGSYVFLTEIGYFIQNPAGDIHWIQSAPYFEVVVANDGNTVWSMYNPKFIPMIGYPKCTLLQVNIPTSTIKEYVFNNCPCNENGGGFITMDLHAVDVDAFGNPHVLYTCNFDDLYLLNQSQVLTTWQDKKLNFFNGPFYFNLSQMLVTIINPSPTNVSGFNVYLNNKTTSQAVIFSDTKIAAAVPLNNNYCIVGMQYDKNATYYVVEIPSLAIVTKSHTNTAFDFNLKNQFMNFVPLGGDNTGPGFEVIASEVGLRNVALIQPNGTYTNNSFAYPTEGIFGTSNPNQFYYYAGVNESMIAVQLYVVS